MPRQNRVTPFGTLLATPERGTLMGNRGCLHDARGQIQRAFVGRRWIICRLNFKGRRRAVMTPGQYTELFFLDEATALAAGHRPCAECQRERFNLFRECWRLAQPGPPAPLSAPALDAILHAERTAGPVVALADWEAVAALPAGACLADAAQAPYLVWQGRLLRWSPAGYTPASRPALRFPARLLTPPSTVRVLAAGYPVEVHPSAQ